MRTHAASILLGFALLALACAARAGPPDGAYLDGGAVRTGVILVHGRFGGRGDARSAVVEPLRIAIHKRLGYHTLSINYPQTRHSRGGADEAGNFPAAWQRIDSAVAFLAQEKGVTRIFVLGHSLGTRITASYLARNAVPGLAGYVGVGIIGGSRDCGEGEPDPLNTRCNIAALIAKHKALPILDVVAAVEPHDMRFARGRMEFASPNYSQVLIEGADHRFERKEEEMLATVVDWMKRVSIPATAN